MKILVIGDIHGTLGRSVLRDNLSKIKKDNQIDLIIANIENTTNGKGLSWNHYKELKNYQIDLMTSGNHIFANFETTKFINSTNDLLRPINFNPYHPGKGSLTLKFKNKLIRLTNLIGVVDMHPFGGSNPFFALEKILKEEKKCDIHLVDFHAQATAEKKSLAIEFDGKITALWGTHTHVQTADEEIMPKGTAYITDVGMTGSAEGVIGADPEFIVKRSKYGLPAPIIPYKIGKRQINAIIIEIDEITNKAVQIQRIFIRD